ncbi:LysR family transcriptional regulator [Acidovorax sp. SRB_14]|uniref:LysR family transcriptional regulator n=1 Tax=unclassified Acidovorax TaxID=2684926 RepID=UPI00145E7336|nr:MULTISPECIES: LysR family transcriptional regulator [unclassified Acidovorax]NMM76517.1 LysR family transcriptional regulator [Acidovorax sp. SRB_24]NMM79339.1 LysR family transcriptional regulator [Acidovorax sp. SRB_14]NMM84591.1 LysR family transcriptional regulator [Rhodococcus sp. SRB_17]
MQNARNVLTPDSLAMLQCIAQAGSFAAAARQLGLVPSALTYRVRQIEDALDVLLFDRSARQARPTEAGAELLREGARLLQEIDAVAHRVQRVATGWEPQLTIAVDGAISPHTLLELVESFYAQAPPTRLKLRDEILSGTLEALTSGQADLAIGVAVNASNVAGLQQGLLGETPFIFAVAPHHPLARAPEPLSDATLLQHRVVAVADSARGDNVSMGMLGGQDVLTVGSMQAKVQAQLRGLGCGFLPEPMVRPYIEAGRLVTRRVERSARSIRMHYAWNGTPHGPQGRALQWWLAQLQSPATQAALLENHHHF